MRGNKERLKPKRLKMRRDKSHEYLTKCWHISMEINPHQFSITTIRKKLLCKISCKKKKLYGRKQEKEY